MSIQTRIILWMLAVPLPLSAVFLFLIRWADKEAERVVKEAESVVTCPYCKEFTVPFYGANSMRIMSTHKARCPKKRYLGGRLNIEAICGTLTCGICQECRDYEDWRDNCDWE